MVVENARFTIQAGKEAEFEAAYQEARGLLLDTPGCRSARMHRGVEDPSTYLLLVEWDAIDNHLVDFRDSDRFVRWRQLIGPYFDGQPSVDHFQPLARP